MLKSKKNDFGSSMCCQSLNITQRTQKNTETEMISNEKENQKKGNVQVNDNEEIKMKPQ